MFVLRAICNTQINSVGKTETSLNHKPGGTNSNHCALQSQFYDGFFFILRAIVAWLDAGLVGNPT